MTQRHFQYQIWWKFKHFGATKNEWKAFSYQIAMSSGSNYSCPLADKTRGKRSNSVLGVFHPNLRQSCNDNRITICRFHDEISHVSNFHIHWVTGESSVSILVAPIRNQLRIPNTKVMLAIRSLWEDCNCRTEIRNRQLTCCISPINHVCSSHSLQVLFSYRKFPLFVLYFRWLHSASNICEGVDSCLQSNTCWWQKWKFQL